MSLHTCLRPSGLARFSSFTNLYFIIVINQFKLSTIFHCHWHSYAFSLDTTVVQEAWRNTVLIPQKKQNFTGIEREARRCTDNSGIVVHFHVPYDLPLIQQPTANLLASVTGTRSPKPNVVNFDARFRRLQEASFLRLSMTM